MNEIRASFVSVPPHDRIFSASPAKRPETIRVKKPVYRRVWFRRLARVTAVVVAASAFGSALALLSRLPGHS